MAQIPYHTLHSTAVDQRRFLEDLVEAVTGTNPTTPDGDEWSVVECYDGTIREVPAGGLLSNCTSTWAPGGTTPAISSWIVLQSAGSSLVSNTFQVYFKIDSADIIRIELYPLANWVTGGPVTATPTRPALRTNTTTVTGITAINRFSLVWDADVIAFSRLTNANATGGPTYLGALDVIEGSTYANGYPFVHYATGISNGWADSIWQMHQPELGTLKTNGTAAPTSVPGTGDATSILQYKIEPVTVYFGGASGFYAGTARHIGMLQYYREAEVAGIYLLSPPSTTDRDWLFYRDGTTGVNNNNGSCIRHDGTAIAGATDRTRFTGWVPGDEVSTGAPVTDPPVITFVTTGSIAAGDDIIVEVTDDSSLEDVVISAAYTSGTQVVYTALGFTSGYSGSSTSPIAGGTSFTLSNNAGWFENVTITVRAIDDGANITTDTEALTVTGGPGFPLEVIPGNDPVINWITAAGAHAAAAAVVVEVTDDLNYTDATIWVTYGAIKQLIHSNGEFASKYSGSSATPITGGYSFNLLCVDDWYQDFTIHILATDQYGNTTLDNRVFTVADGPGLPTEVFTGAAPTINWITAAGAHLAPDPVVVEVTDDLNYTDAIIWATYGATKQLIHGGGEFSGKYSGSSATPITGGYSFSLLCDDNWYEDFTIHILASDQYGNTTLDTRAFTVADGLGLPLEVTGGGAPAINWVTAAGTLPAADPVVVEVTDDLSYEDTTIWAIFGVNKFIVYSNGEFASSFSGSSITPITGGVSFNLVCSPGWFSAFTLYVLGRDTADQTTLDSRTWLVYDGPGVPVVPSVDDTESPLLSDIEPASLTGLRKLDPISFTVSDNSGFVLTTTISVEYANGDHEVVYNGGFSRKFAPSSRRVATVNGYRYTLRRAGGWASEPTIWVIVYDRTGNSLRLQVS